jgi:hypothetical protein
VRGHTHGAPEKRIVRIHYRRRAAAINPGFCARPDRTLNMCWILENMFAGSGGMTILPV